jgi:hypothetical protein
MAKMSTPAKVAIVVFILFVACVAGGIGTLVYFGGKALKAQNDPAAAKRTAAKIAAFDVPKGYRLKNAVDMGIQQQIDIVPEGHSDFRISLQGGYSSLDPDTRAQIMGSTLSVAGRAFACNAVSLPDDDVTAGGSVVKLHVRACPDAKVPFRIEAGAVPVRSGSVLVTALGVGTDFDTTALHALIRSMR